MSCGKTILRLRLLDSDWIIIVSGEDLLSYTRILSNSKIMYTGGNVSQCHHSYGRGCHVTTQHCPMNALYCIVRAIMPSSSMSFPTGTFVTIIMTLPTASNVITNHSLKLRKQVNCKVRQPSKSRQQMGLKKSVRFPP